MTPQPELPRASKSWCSSSYRAITQSILFYTLSYEDHLETAKRFCLFKICIHSCDSQTEIPNGECENDLDILNFIGF